MKTATLILLFTTAIISAQQESINKIVSPILNHTSINPLYSQTIKMDTYGYYGNLISSEVEYNSGSVYRTNVNGKTSSALRERNPGSIHTYEFDGTVNSEYGSREPNSMSTHSDGSFSIYDSSGGSQRYLNGTLISTTKQKPED